LEDLLEEADDILREMQANPQPPGEYDTGFVSPFNIYPAALAISFVPRSLLNVIETKLFRIFRMKGYCHSRMAPLCRPDVDAAIDHYRKAGNFYVEAASIYPEDDENHACKLFQLNPLPRITATLKHSLV